jgi:hypothetical protein
MQRLLVASVCRKQVPGNALGRNEVTRTKAGYQLPDILFSARSVVPVHRIYPSI